MQPTYQRCPHPPLASVALSLGYQEDHQRLSSAAQGEELLTKPHSRIMHLYHLLPARLRQGVSPLYSRDGSSLAHFGTHTKRQRLMEQTTQEQKGRLLPKPWTAFTLGREKVKESLACVSLPVGAPLVGKAKAIALQPPPPNYQGSTETKWTKEFSSSHLLLFSKENDAKI